MTNLLALDRPHILPLLVTQGVSRDAWIALTGEFADHGYRHSWDYAAAMAERSGATVENVAILQDQRAVALASVRVKRLPGMRTGIAYVSGGPLVRHRAPRASDPSLDLVIAALKEEYVDRRRLVLRVAPPIGDAAWNEVQAGCFESAGFARTDRVDPYTTVLVDIDRPLEQIRSGFAQKWRNCLNKAERQDLRVTDGRDPRLFDDFIPLFDELVARKAFDVDLGADFYARLQERLPDGERLYVAIAWDGDDPVAGVVASMHGDTPVYLLGAANHAARKSNAAYLLQWRAIEEASRSGCRWYDLGGVDAEANPGVRKFKLGMGGTELSSPGPYELAPGPIRGAAVRGAERIVKVIRSR
jgi:lipid II:glycine glycyltransferase (peptidoglycan interpeptide bridge formation enzyme)